MDADTTPAPRALAEMARAFADPDVMSAAGVVGVRNARDGWLTRHQHVEYQRVTWTRVAWSSLGALEQVPGAFTGVRADAFAAVGGFPTDSLTEDYELTYRLVARGVRDGRAQVVVTVPQAMVWTVVPNTLAGFVRQRTRWFAGFLTTLVRFRRLIFEPRAMTFGLVRLPLKLVDAIVPLLAFASLAVLATGGTKAFGVSAVAVALFGARWLWDVVSYAAITRAYGVPSHGGRAGLDTKAASAWWFAISDGFAFAWLRYAATIRAYVWAFRRLRTWERSREETPVVQSVPTPLH